MAELKTKQTKASVQAFLESVSDETQRKDCLKIMGLMQQITGEKPKMWGNSIVGFGNYRYKYASGREGEWFVTGFSPRKTSLTLYIMSGFSRYEDLLGKLGKHKTGKSCLYVKSLAEIDQAVLGRLVEEVGGSAPRIEVRRTQRQAESIGQRWSQKIRGNVGGAKT